MLWLRFFPLFWGPTEQEPVYQVSERDPISKMLCLNEAKMMSSFQNNIRVCHNAARSATIWLGLIFMQYYMFRFWVLQQKKHGLEWRICRAINHTSLASTEDRNWAWHSPAFMMSWKEKVWPLHYFKYVIIISKFCLFIDTFKLKACYVNSNGVFEVRWCFVVWMFHPA